MCCKINIYIVYEQDTAFVINLQDRMHIDDTVS